MTVPFVWLRQKESQYVVIPFAKWQESANDDLFTELRSR
jgi:hypothetical protein